MRIIVICIDAVVVSPEASTGDLLHQIIEHGLGQIVEGFGPFLVAEIGVVEVNPLLVVFQYLLFFGGEFRIVKLRMWWELLVCGCTLDVIVLGHCGARRLLLPVYTYLAWWHAQLLLQSLDRRERFLEHPVSAMYVHESGGFTSSIHDDSTLLPMIVVSLHRD